MDDLSGWREGTNKQEVTMHNQRPTNRFIAHEKALEAASIAISVVLNVPAPLRSLADQVVRSASSVPANLSEGAGRSGKTAHATGESPMDPPRRLTITSAF